MRVLALCILSLTIPAVARAQMPDAKELIANPKYLEKSRAPSYVQLSDEGLRDEIEVLTNRDSAMIGFNLSEIQLYLPKVDNSIASIVKFSPAKLYDAKNESVPFTLERGIYDFKSYSTEIRFGRRNTPNAPAEFARAVGTISLRYPTSVKTLVAKRGKKASSGFTPKFDGPFVSWTLDREPLEMATFSTLASVRAYDAKGSELQLHPYHESSMEEGVTTRTQTWFGDVAQLQIDVADRWTEIAIQYDLPPIPPLPEDRAGLGSGLGRGRVIPGAKVEKTIVPAAGASQ